MKKYNAAAMWCHLGAFAGIIFPFGNFLVPLILWLARRHEDELVDDQGKESLNFQISVFLSGIASGVLVFLIVGIFLLIALFFFTVVQVIKASLSASEGRPYRYPLCIRFIK
jgi:uncharacterized protein